MKKNIMNKMLQLSSRAITVWHLLVSTLLEFNFPHAYKHKFKFQKKFKSTPSKSYQNSHVLTALE